MKILAIDPGTTKSAYVIYDPDINIIDDYGIRENGDIFEALKTVRGKTDEETRFVVEMIKSYGNAMGDECLETCVWIGRFIEAWGDDETAVKLPRKTIVTNLCMNPRAKDSNVRQALIDRWGGQAKAIGNKKAPGPLYKIKKDMWSALAIAIVFSDLNNLDFLR